MRGTVRHLGPRRETRERDDHENGRQNHQAPAVTVATASDPVAHTGGTQRQRNSHQDWPYSWYDTSVTEPKSETSMTHTR